MRRRTRVGLVGAALTGVVAMSLLPSWTSAGFTSTEVAGMTASAGVVPVPTSTCTPNSGSPHQLSFGPGADGLATQGYLVTMATTLLPSGWTWQSGTSDGLPLAPLGESTWTLDQTSVKFGIELPFLAGGTATGTATVQAIGPGGWESAPVVYDWSIIADWGVTTVACTVRPA